MPHGIARWLVAAWIAGWGSARGDGEAAPVLTSSSSVGLLRGTRFSVEADELEAFRAEGVYRARGGVVVRRGETILYADRVEFDQRSGTVTAEGHVVAIDGRSVLSCHRAVLALPELQGGLDQVELRIKRGIRPEVLARSSTVARWLGQDEAIVDADRLVRVGSTRYEVDRVSVTACDCPDDEAPSWSIRARRGSIDLKSGAWLYWPVFTLRSVPVFALPVFYLPLGERRSGLLAPRLSVRPNVTGLGVRQPLYLVLGESFDITLEPGYYTARGPFADLEFRYAPHASTRGTWRASYVADLGPQGRDENKLVSRYALVGRHETRLDATRFIADVNAVGDPEYVSELADGFLARQAEFTRSRLVAVSQRGFVRLAAQTHLLQDLRPEVYRDSGVPLREVSLFSGMSPGPSDVRYRLAEVRLDAPVAPWFETNERPERFISGPVGGARFTAAAYAAPASSVSRFVRVDFRPEIRWPWSVGPVGLEVYGFARTATWAGRDEAKSYTASRLAGGLGASSFVRLSRRYSGLVHVVRPSVEYRIVPDVWRSADVERFDTGDEVDQLFARHQVLGRVDTTFMAADRLVRRGGLTLMLGRDLAGLEERSAGWSEAVVEGNVLHRLGGLHFGVRGRLAVDVETPRVVEASGSLSLRGASGSVSVVGSRLSDSIPRYPLIAHEELVPSRSRSTAEYVPLDVFRGLDPETQRTVRPWSALEALAVKVSVRPLEPLTLAVSAVLTFQNQDLLAQIYPDGGPRSWVRELGGTVRWDSPCQCWNALLSVATARDQPLTVRFGLELAQLGSVAP